MSGKCQYCLPQCSHIETIQHTVTPGVCCLCLCGSQALLLEQMLLEKNNVCYGHRAVLVDVSDFGIIIGLQNLLEVFLQN